MVICWFNAFQFHRNGWKEEKLMLICLPYLMAGKLFRMALAMLILVYWRENQSKHPNKFERRRCGTWVHVMILSIWSSQSWQAHPSWHRSKAKPKYSTCLLWNHRFPDIIHVYHISQGAAHRIFIIRKI